MAKTSRLDKPGTEMVKGTSANFLARYQESDQSLATMEAYVIVPRLKIIQPMSDTELKKRFGEGTAIIRPGDVVISEDGGSFSFVPQFFFTEFCKWADRRDKESQMILERTYDPTSPLAKRTQDKNSRFELYPNQESKRPEDQLKYRYVQHFCWAGAMYGDHIQAGTSVVLSMEKGEHGNGRAFISAISMRKEKVGEEAVRVPLWAQVWSMTPALRDKTQGKWYGFDFQAAGVIKDEEADIFQAEYARLSQLHEANRLRVDHAEGDESAGEEEEKPKDSGKF